jgi:hypothetical protein
VNRYLTSHCEESVRGDSLERSTKQSPDSTQRIASSNDSPFGRFVLLAMTVKK